MSAPSHTFGPATLRFAGLHDTRPAHEAVASALGKAAGRIRGWFREFARRQRMASSLYTFAAGDERALKDLGLSRAQAHYAAERLAWGRSSVPGTDPDPA